MVFISSLNISSSDIGAAIAQAVIHDINVNASALDGFPEISVSRPNGNTFEISMRYAEYSQNFELTNDEAKKAVQRMKKQNRHSEEIFERVQNALAHLEAKKS